MQKLEQMLEELHREVRALRENPHSKLPVVLTKKMAARELSVSLSKLRGMIRDGKIVTCDVGETQGVPSSEVFRIAEARLSAAKTPRSERPRRAPTRPSGGPTEAEKMRAALKKR